jgi:hypothetical protein
MDETGAVLSDVEVLDPGGQPVRLGTFWAKKPAVLALVRHFG